VTTARGGRAAGNGQVSTEGLFDLKAAAAAEADDTPFAFTYGGLVLQVPPQKKWPVKAMRMLTGDDADPIAAFELLFGKEVFGQLCDAGLLFGEITKLMEAVAAAAGLEGGPTSPRRPPASTRR
jgi:hypothetical protein